MNFIIETSRDIVFSPFRRHPSLGGLTRDRRVINEKKRTIGWWVVVLKRGISRTSVEVAEAGTRARGVVLALYRLPDGLHDEL